MHPTDSQEIERALARAIAAQTPDLLSQVADTPVAPTSGDDPLLPHLPSRRTPLRAAASLCACLALVLFLGFASYFQTAAIIDLDLNPSIELTANRYDRVLQVRALNEDAQAILGEMKLTNLDLDTAVNAIIGAMFRHGYFSTSGEDTAVLVSVSGGSRENNSALQQKLALDIRQAVSAGGGRAQVLTLNTSKTSPGHTSEGDSVQTRADQNGISYGKQVFLDRLLTLDPSLNQQKLASMSISQIAQLVQVRGLDLSRIVDYDSDDSTHENIEDFIEDTNEGQGAGHGDDDDDSDDDDNSNDDDDDDSDDDDNDDDSSDGDDSDDDSSDDDD